VRVIILEVEKWFDFILFDLFALAGMQGTHVTFSKHTFDDEFLY